MSERIDWTIVRGWAVEAGVCPLGGMEAAAMAGGASPRLWWRFVAADGRSVVAMVAPPSALSTDEHGAAPEDPLARWVRMRDVLAGRGVSVPVVYGAAPNRRDDGLAAVFIEDLGDHRLFEAWHAASEFDDGLALYRQAAELLSDFQARTTGLSVPSIFDAASMHAELDEFLRMGLEHRHRITVTDADRALWSAFVNDIVARLDALPRVFSHRDFQSQNLMWPASGPVIIDFQDGFMAPAAYDWVALLRDSYIDPGVDGVSNILAVASEHVRQTFHLQTIQRKLKDAGRFITLAERGKPWFLQWYPRTIGYVVHALQATGDYPDILAFLQRYIPEARRPA